ncbi:MAG: enoyl-CoA hydratase/isomerase family protein [Solirubrobacteraceae bacterium]
MPELVTVKIEGAACVLTLNRPDKLNALSDELLALLCETLASEAVREARCVVFTGSERVFSAGADLREPASYTPEDLMASYRATGDFAERVADLPQPTICAIAGYCIGGGLELALACDFRVAERNADFRFPEVALGILPSWGGTQRAVRLLGPARAKELVLLRERVDAERALAMGLVTEIAAEGESLPRALEMAARLAALPALAVSVTTAVIDALPETSRGAGLQLERLAYGMLAQTGEAGEALSARWS